MNGLNNNSEDVAECPLCMEPLEVDDLNFFPCTCGYQICRFCWHRIRTDENELCPACRKEYPENPADFTPLSQEEILAFKSQKRQRDQQRKQKITENRKHLSNVRVVQKNLVFVVGLPPRLADAEILKKHEYFGKYGKIHKVVINPSTTYAGVQGPSASAYVTYIHNNDALRAIQSVNNVLIDGRLIKTSLGTTKYCSHFMKNTQCPKSDCMYLHELGDPEASFTKEEMHQGKHQEYEKRLHDTLIATSGTSSVCGIGNSTNNSVGMSNHAVPATSSHQGSLTTVTCTQHKEAWPTLTLSPLTNKEIGVGIGVVSAKKKEKNKNEKSRIEKQPKSKCNKSVILGNNSCSRNQENCNSLKDRCATLSYEHPLELTNELQNTPANINTSLSKGKLKSDKVKDKSITNFNTKEYSCNHQHDVVKKCAVSVYEEKKHLESVDKQIDVNKRVNTLNNSNIKTTPSKFDRFKNGDERSISSNSNVTNNSSGNNGDMLPLVECVSGKSTPGTLLESISSSDKLENTHRLEDITLERPVAFSNTVLSNSCVNISNPNKIAVGSSDITPYENNENNISSLYLDELQLTKGTGSKNLYDTKVARSQLSLFDDNESFFSIPSAVQHSMFIKSKFDDRQKHPKNVTSHLPDLLKGVDEYQNNRNKDDYDESCKTIIGVSKPSDNPDKIKHDEILQLQELQKRNSLLHAINLSQLNMPRSEFLSSSNNFNNNELDRSTQTLTLQQQQPVHVSDQLFDTNMLKFFDFHKNQQQQLHQQYLINSHIGESGGSILNDHLCMPYLLENSRINSQYLDQSAGILSSQQQLQLKHKNFGKLDSVLALKQHQSQNRQNQQDYLQNQFPQNSYADDDLGFDPFIETQKGLAELMENEILQQQHVKTDSVTATIPPKIVHHEPYQRIMDNMQRARLPPPGFNHMNAFGFGIPRVVSKVTPFMNTSNNSTLQQLPHSWNLIPTFTQQQQTVNDQVHHINQNQGHINKDTSNDWTAMDPAILSFRQFSSYPQQTQISQQLQQQDLYMQHLKQQQNNQGFVSQLQGSPNFSNNPHSSQATSQAAVNANVQGMLEFLKTRQFT